jgi:hypothetical protein
VWEYYEIVATGRASTLYFELKGKGIPITGHEDPWGCETSRLPHFLDNWLIDGSEVVILTHWPPITPHEDSRYSFVRG